MTEVTVQPLVSVVMATFNAAATLWQALESVFAQNGVRVEVIVMDGGSTDGTVAILQKNAQHIGYWESERDRGIYHAWNKALTRAQGEWVHFLGADDEYWDEYALARLVEGAATSDSVLRYGQVVMLNPAGQPAAVLGKRWSLAQDGFDKMPFPHPGVLHRRELFERYGGFDESFRIAGDFAWFCKVLPHEKAVYVADAPVVAMSLGGASTHPRQMARVIAENRRARAVNGIAESRVSPGGKLVEWGTLAAARCLPEPWVGWLVRRYYRQISLPGPLPTALPSAPWRP